MHFVGDGNEGAQEATQPCWEEAEKGSRQRDVFCETDRVVEILLVAA